MSYSRYRGSQGIVQPRQISIATLAPKLALQPHYRDVGIEPSSPTLDGIGRADVFQRDPLVFIDEKHRATSGTDHFLDLVLALVAVEATFSFSRWASSTIKHSQELDSIPMYDPEPQNRPSISRFRRDPAKRSL